MKQITLFTCLLILVGWHCTQPEEKVYLIPTLHGLHKTNENYTYDTLVNLIRRLDPDVIAVEIRQEDINKDSSYLSKNYPYEMRMVPYWFKHVKVLGFDWVGKDIEGKSIPSNYWKEISPIKRFERELHADSLIDFNFLTCDTFAIQRLKILKNKSLPEILKSDDSLLTQKYYECLREVVKGTIHERVLNFYNERNEKILSNLNTILLKNKGKKIVILTGDDHFIFLKNRFKNNQLPL